MPPLAEPEAVELFCERARLEPDETIAELCRRLDELPLALELAAARTRVLTPAQILDRLGQRLDLLKGGRDADPRQQTLRATIEWSHDLLTDDEKQLFARLAVFAGGCTLDAAEDVCDADLDLLQSLVDKSLLRHTGDRFWMLETIREFAVERLQQLADAGEIFERHAQWYLGLAKSAQGELRGAAAEEWLGRLDADLENLRRAIGWARDHDARLEVELVGATWYFLSVRGLFREALNYLVHALETARSTSFDHAELLRGAGSVAFELGDNAASQEWFEELLELGRARGDAQSIAESLAILADVTVQGRDLERSRTLILDAADAARACGDMEIVDVGRPWPRGDRPRSRRRGNRAQALPRRARTGARATKRTERGHRVVQLVASGAPRGRHGRRCRLPRRLPAAFERSRRTDGDLRVPGGIGRGRRATR